MRTPEDQAREHIDQALEQAGWRVPDYKSANLHAGRGVMLRNSPFQSGHGFADYLLDLDGKSAGGVGAKTEGFPLIWVEIQSAKYSEGVLPQLPAHVPPLPALYHSTGVETRFTNGLDPEPSSRQIISSDKPDTLADWLDKAGVNSQASIRTYVAANLVVERDDSESAPFAQEGDVGKVHRLFEPELNGLLEDLNGTVFA